MALTRLIQTHTPRGAIAKLDSLPDDHQDLYQARGEFFSVWRRGRLHFSDGVNDAVQDISGRMTTLTGYLSTRRDTKKLATEDPVRNLIGSTVVGLSFLSDRMRNDVQGTQDDVVTPKRRWYGPFSRSADSAT